MNENSTNKPSFKDLANQLAVSLLRRVVQADYVKREVGDPASYKEFAEAISNAERLLKTIERKENNHG